MAHEHGHAISKAMEECIRLCIECARTCEACYGECVRMDMAGMATCVALCRDCADICMTDAQFMSRGSEFHLDLCAVCADVCDACADECERMAAEHQGESSEMFQRCAETCRRCAESCRTMAGGEAGIEGATKKRIPTRDWRVHAKRAPLSRGPGWQRCRAV